MIARRRKRPRVHSSSFRALWWLVHRQAAWHAIHGPSSPAEFPQLALQFMKAQRVVLTYRVQRMDKLARLADAS